MRKKNSGFRETNWIFALVGTAIGAGILYLPLEAGRESIWALFLLTVVMFPLIYLAHKNVARMLLLGHGQLDYTGVITQQFGPFFGLLATFLFLLTFFTVLVSYSTGLNTSIGDALFQAGITSTDLAEGPLLSLLFLTTFLILNFIGQKAVLRLMTAVTAILMVGLLGLSLYLVPYWSFDKFTQPISPGLFVADLFSLLPILSLSFVFFPAMPTMTMELRQAFDIQWPDEATDRMHRIILKAAIVLFAFTLLFVLSTLLSLTSDEFTNAIEGNLNCLTVLSHRDGISHRLAFTGVMIGLAALFTSFVGVYFAVRDCAGELLSRMLALMGWNASPGLPGGKKSARILVLVIMLLLWLITVSNPSILDAFGLVISPLVAIFIFIFPGIILAKHDGWKTLLEPGQLFVLASGILILFSYELGTLIHAFFTPPG
jgi:serine transporter